MKHRFTTRDHHPGKLAGIRRVLKKFLLLSFLLSSPLPADEIVSETDQLILYRERSGHLAPVHRNPRRVIASIGSLADIWYAAGGKLIALPDVKSKETLPEGARNLPSIGGFSTPNLERILVLKPDLVLLSEKLQTHHAIRPLLENAGVETLLLCYNDYRDFQVLLHLFCRLNGSEAATSSAPKRIAAEINGITGHAARLSSPSLAILFVYGKGFSIEGPGTNTGRMAAMLGARNIRKEEIPPRIRFSFEQLLLDDPDVLLLNTMGDADKLQEKLARELTSQPAWKQLKAVRNNRVHFLPPELFLYVPGSRFPEAFRHLAELLYPGEKFP